MAETARFLPITVEDYLAGELHSDVRHEYIDGQVYAMVGASTAHNIITLNLAAELRAYLRGTPCRVFMTDMKLRIRLQNKECFYYPDIQVCCDPTDRENYYRTRPRLIVEVSSPHTEREDRSSKFYAYRQIDSLQEYVLIAQDNPRVEVYRRQDNWGVLDIYEGDCEVRLKALDLALPMALIYEAVEFESTEHGKLSLDD